MSHILFTGERLNDDAVLYGPDLARHRAAYLFAMKVGGTRALDLGCGTGYGSAELADTLGSVVAVDRIAPDANARRPSAHFLRADLNGIPLAPRSFDLVVSFQVIEHLEDPSVYLQSIAGLLRESGTALLTTPNRLTSDGVNPFHVREYTADELARSLGRVFAEVEMKGIGATPEVARYLEARLARIRRIMKLDPLGLRDRLPRRLVEWLFARFSVLVRRGIQQDEGLPEVTPDDYPIGEADDACVDLLAVCRAPRVE